MNLTESGQHVYHLLTSKEEENVKLGVQLLSALFEISFYDAEKILVHFIRVDSYSRNMLINSVYCVAKHQKFFLLKFGDIYYFISGFSHNPIISQLGKNEFYIYVENCKIKEFEEKITNE